jgi:hypothetical protein
LSFSVTGTQPSVFASPETASVFGSLSLDSSLAVDLDDFSLREGTLGDLPIRVSSSALAERLDITVQCTPLSGSAVGTIFQLPAAFTPFIDTSTPIAGKLSLRQVPVSLLRLMSSADGISTYQLPLTVSLAEGQNLYWNIGITAQDYLASQPLNSPVQQGTTVVVQEKPRAPEVDAEAALLSSDSLTQGTRTQVRLDGLFSNPAGGVASYRLTSSDSSVVEVLPGSATSPFRTVLAKSPGDGSLTACMTNRHNLTACTTPQRVRVPNPTSVQARKNDPWPSIGSGIGVVGVVLAVLILVGPILHSYKKQQHQAQDLIRRNRDRKAERSNFLTGLAGITEPPLIEHLTAIESTLISVAHQPLLDALKLVFRGYFALHLANPALPSSTRLTLAITRIKDAIGGVSRANNPQTTVNQLIALLTFSTLLAATRTENAHPVGYDWRIGMLRWIDDQVSLLQGKSPLDTQIKALFKLIRHTLQPLTTNETPVHYFFRHLTSIPVMIIRYCRSRRDQGDSRETEKTIDGVLAFWSSTEQPKLAKNFAAHLQSMKDWRLKVLGVMILHALNDTARLNSERQVAFPRQPSERRLPLLCCAKKRSPRGKSLRSAHLAEHFYASTPEALPEGKAAPADSGAGVSAPFASGATIQNPLHTGREKGMTQPLPGQVPPPPLPPPPGAFPVALALATGQHPPRAARVQQAGRLPAKPKPPATPAAGSPGGNLEVLSPTTAAAFAAKGTEGTGVDHVP